ncbi:MAG: thermonuclease family protein [Pelagimonas sp.]|jgi:endonuclease YncB( thermonuclease family)|nr:thermonuclease family protein [Pelagimonas sp.]
MLRLFMICLLLAAGCTTSGGLSVSAIAYLPDRDSAVCVITRVVDGDTVEGQCHETASMNWRLVGFDTPETYRPKCEAERRAGEHAKNVLTALLRNATQIVPRFEGTDRYNRPLVRLELDGVDLAQQMVGRGLARPYSGGKRQSWCSA